MLPLSACVVTCKLPVKLKELSSVQGDSNEHGDLFRVIKMNIEICSG